MKLVRRSRTTASQANRGKSVNDSIAEEGRLLAASLLPQCLDAQLSGKLTSRIQG